MLNAVIKDLALNNLGLLQTIQFVEGGSKALCVVDGCWLPPTTRRNLEKQDLFKYFSTRIEISILQQLDRELFHSSQTLGAVKG